MCIINLIFRGIGMSELKYSNEQIDLVVRGLASLENFGDCVGGSKIIRQLQKRIEELEIRLANSKKFQQETAKNCNELCGKFGAEVKVKQQCIEELEAEAALSDKAWDIQRERLEELEKYEEKCTAIVKYIRTDKMEGVMAVIAEIGLLIPPKKEL